MTDCARFAESSGITGIYGMTGIPAMTGMPVITGIPAPGTGSVVSVSDVRHGVCVCMIDDRYM